MPEITTVFFDMGGTLAHPRLSFNGLLSEVCQSEGLDVSREQALRAEPLVWSRIGADPRGGRGFSLSTQRSHEFWLWVYGVFLEELGYPNAGHVPQRLFEAFTRPENYQLFDDALPTLTRLRETGFNLGIISNWEAWASDLLTALGLAELLDYTVISGAVGYEKPDPEIFHAALTTADVPPPQAMHVGDNPVDDVEGARAVGMRAVLIDRELASAPREPAPGQALALPTERRAPLIPRGYPQVPAREGKRQPAGRRASEAEANRPDSVTVGSLVDLLPLLGID